MPGKGTMKGKRTNKEKKRLKENKRLYACIDFFSESDAVLFTFHPRVFNFLKTPSKFIHFTRQPCSSLDR